VKAGSFCKLFLGPFQGNSPPPNCRPEQPLWILWHIFMFCRLETMSTETISITLRTLISIMRWRITMIYRKADESEGNRVANPVPTVQELPKLSQQQWLCLVRMLMSAGDLEILTCGTEELAEYGPIFYRTVPGRIELCVNGDFDDDDEEEEG
jgi:hypothetical protein